ncbi:MAG TPA: iron-sulfur cluster assembly scaffold protein [Pyrinomonadaceae bacterium]|nr:iron-sulfur cluster assembly scaffold protein [Pyrinomonadaceae bacterium]
MSYYPARVNEHFLHPRNVGEAAEPRVAGEAGSLACGAILVLTLNIDSRSQQITDARFKAVGCGYLVAAASVLTETIKDLSPGRAAVLSETAVTDWLGQMPAEREHCARLCREALNAALANYHSAAREEWAGDEALICTCFCVSERTIERVVKARSLRTVEEVTRACHAGGGCRSCHPLIADLLDDYWRTRTCAP